MNTTRKFMLSREGGDTLTKGAFHCGSNTIEAFKAKVHKAYYHHCGMRPKGMKVTFEDYMSMFI